MHFAHCIKNILCLVKSLSEKETEDNKSLRKCDHKDISL